MSGQPETVGAKSICLDDFSPGLQVLLVNGEDQVRVREVQFVVTTIDEDTASIEDRTHGSIGEHGAIGKEIGELRHAEVNAIAKAMKSQLVGVELRCTAVELRRRDIQPNQWVALL